MSKITKNGRHVPEWEPPYQSTELSDEIWEQMDETERDDLIRFMLQALCAPEGGPETDRLFGQLVSFEKKMIAKYVPERNK